MRYTRQIAENTDIPNKPAMVRLLKGIENLWKEQSTNVIVRDLRKMGYETYKREPLEDCKRSIAQLIRYIREGTH